MPPFRPNFRSTASLLTLALFFAFNADSQPPSQTPFLPPAGVLVAGLRETATHRGPIPGLRIASDHETQSSANFWLHLDASGHVLEVKDITTESYQHPHFDRNEFIEAMRKVTYAPFLRNGDPVEAWAQDTVELLPRANATLPTKSLHAVTSFPEPKPSTDFAIQLSRSGCLGSCSGYSVTIHGDGTINYKGGWYVSIEGEHNAHISPQAARELLERFRDANFFALKSEYRAGVTDNPTYCLELRVGTRKKTVTDYVGEWVGMPAAVTELEDAVDQTADSDRWVTASPQTLEAMRDAGISASSNVGSQILRRAVAYGKPEAVRELLAAGVSTSPISKPKNMIEMGVYSGSLLENTANDHADSKSQKEVIAALLENAAVRADKQEIQKALGRAAVQGRPDIARMLIAAGKTKNLLIRPISCMRSNPGCGP